MDIALYDDDLKMPSSLLGFGPGEFGQWLTRHLPDECGHTDFRVAQLCSDISLTRSECCFAFPYHALLSHPYDVTLLIFGIKGVSDFSLINGDNERYTVRPGDIWLFNSGGEALRRSTPKGIGTEMVVLKYQTARILSAFLDIEGFDKQILKKGAQRLARGEDAYRWLAGLLNNPLKTGAERLMAEAKALELLARWIRPITADCTHFLPLLPDKDNSAIEQVMDILLQDLTQSVSLYQLSQRVGMSHTRLNRCFKQLTGLTVFAWLRQQRLRRAENYLRDNRWSISDVAQLCGFSSASHFTETFKAEHGCTPAKYRQKLSMNFLS